MMFILFLFSCATSFGTSAPCEEGIATFDVDNPPSQAIQSDGRRTMGPLTWYLADGVLSVQCDDGWTVEVE